MIDFKSTLIVLICTIFVTSVFCQSNASVCATYKNDCVGCMSLPASSGCGWCDSTSIQGCELKDAAYGAYPAHQACTIVAALGGGSGWIDSGSAHDCSTNVLTCHQRANKTCSICGDLAGCSWCGGGQLNGCTPDSVGAVLCVDLKGVWQPTQCPADPNCNDTCDPNQQCGSACGIPCGNGCNTNNETCNTNTNMCDPCIPNCQGKECGDNGCGGQCGVCGVSNSQPTACDFNTGMCSCISGCSVDWECGMDNCLISSCGGGCDSTHTCDDSTHTCQCTIPCTPNQQCGFDTCGNPCGSNNGSCSGLEVCSESGICQCAPQCQNKECGSDGCGSTCGNCSVTETCNTNNLCDCIDGCGNKQCGTDGCGNSCGSCDDGKVCDTQTFVCIDSPNDECDSTRLCPKDKKCVGGFCVPDKNSSASNLTTCLCFLSIAFYLIGK